MTLTKCNTMQKIINVLAVLSFAGVAGIVGGGTYVYFQRDALIESVKEKVTAAATEAIAGALPGMLNSAMPQMPTSTGGVVPKTDAAPARVIPAFP
jgi:hypothetical protein